MTPEEILSAYGIGGITFSGGTVSGDGAGETIAIVDAYKDPNIASDLAAFDAEFGLAAPPSFIVDNLGATTVDAGWALETALDVEWAHAIAPDAKIVLVEASSDSLSALFGAVSYASDLAGVGVVSMSWGSSEFAGETAYDGVFTTPSGHENVTYVAASGDSGAAYGPEYPSVSPNVLAVGGTTLTLSSEGTYVSESGWSDSTGGFSSYESEPSYQTSTLGSVGLSDGVRTTPVVSFDADPDTGVAVYDSIAYDGQSGWFQLGGTSAAAPAWAGLVAIADQGLATGGVGTLSTSEVLTDLYSLPSSDFNDITSGNNGYSATAGYDLVTGLGTPKADQLIAGLLAANGVSESSTTTSSSSGNSTSSTTSSGTTTTSPTSTSTSHHKKEVSIKKTKTHHTRVKREKVEKTRTVATKVRHESLLSTVAVESVSLAASATASVLLNTGSTSESVAASSITSRTTATATDSSQALSVSTSTDQASVIAAVNPAAQQSQPVSATTNSVGQELSRQSSPSDRISGGESQPQSFWLGDDAPLATRTAARSWAVDRSPVVEEVCPWPSSIDRSPDDLDLVIEMLGESPTMRLEPMADPDGMQENRSEFGVSLLVATVALTSGGYYLAIREPLARRKR